MRKRLIIGMRGASGAPLTIELLKQLQQYKEIIETHLIVTKGAEMTLEQETDYTLEQLYVLRTRYMITITSVQVRRVEATVRWE